jgi:hypothetical protein
MRNASAQLATPYARTPLHDRRSEQPSGVGYVQDRAAILDRCLPSADLFTVDSTKSAIFA